MRLDFSSVPLQEQAHSELPITSIGARPREVLSAIVDLVAIETGNRTAREHWQYQQVHHLLVHAARRSPQWRGRIGPPKKRGMRLSDVPPQTRADVIRQFEGEGSLMRPGETGAVSKNSTSGSTGKPVHFFQTIRNGQYNVVRNLAQYFLEGRDISLNRTRFRARQITQEPGFTSKKTDSWLGPLTTMLKSGSNKDVDYFRPNIDALCDELMRDPIGYLVAQPRLLDIVLQRVEPEFFKRAGTAMMIFVSEAMDPKIRDAFSAVGIPMRGTYSSEEVGLIASECDKCPGNYHVATSNVIVEVLQDKTVQLENRSAGRVLLTHLHSYATPFIRYDIGDFATLDECCPCGHDGPALSNIYGRSKSLLKHADGRLTPFFPRGKEFNAVAAFDEYRIRQIDLQTLVLEIGGRTSLSQEEHAAFGALMKLHAGEDFTIKIETAAEIDWGHSIKRPGFSSDVL